MLKIKPNILTPAKNVSADILVPRLFFILCVLFLVLFGLIMVFSASNVEALSQNSNPYNYVLKQFAFCVLGIFIAFLIWRVIPYSVWTNNYIIWALFGGLMVLMVVTLFGGEDILGARRWFYIGGMSFQPSEYAKIILVLIVAKYYAEYKNKHISLIKCLGVTVGITLLMIAFVLGGQSDLGTTVICVIGILALLWIAGLPIYVFGILAALCVVGGIFAIVVSGWRSNRFVFLDPYNDGANGYGAGYQLIRSFYAFAEGGLAGVGLGNSFEKYQYLPEAETDFIFSIIGDELGFIGCIFILIVFSAFMISGMFIALRSKNRFAASVSGAFIIMLGFQALLNILCVIGCAPTTGKPLPFISSGGSSMLASLLMVGFVLAGSEADALPDEYQKARSRFKTESGKASDKILDDGTKQEKIKVEKKNSFKTKIGRPKVSVPKSSSSKVVNSKPSTSKTKATKSRSTVYKRSGSSLGFKPQKLDLSISKNSSKSTSAIPKSRTSNTVSKRKSNSKSSSTRSTVRKRVSSNRVSSVKPRSNINKVSSRSSKGVKANTNVRKNLSCAKTPRQRMGNNSEINSVKLKKRK